MLDVIELLRAKGADVRYHDTCVPTVSHNGYEIQGEPDLDVAQDRFHELTRKKPQ